MGRTSGTAQYSYRNGQRNGHAYTYILLGTNYVGVYRVCVYIYIYIYMCMCICIYMGGCQNYGPLLGTLNIRGRAIIGIQKKDHNFDNHPYTKSDVRLLEIPIVANTYPLARTVPYNSRLQSVQ